MIGRFSSGPMVSRPFDATFDTCVRHVQRGRPLTVIAHDRVGHRRALLLAPLELRLHVGQIQVRDRPVRGEQVGRRLGVVGMQVDLERAAVADEFLAFVGNAPLGTQRGL